MTEQNDPGYSGVMRENNRNTGESEDRDNSTITRPSFSPLTALGNSNSRHGDTGVFEVVEAAVGVAQSQILQVVRSEMIDAVTEAVKQVLSAQVAPNGIPVRPQDNVEWPRDLPPSRVNNSEANQNAEININDVRVRSGNQPGNSLRVYKPNYPELFKWGIKYDGTSKTMLVEDFIFRVEKLQKSYNCPWEIVMDGFHHLLDGQAAKWYWDHIRDRPNINWKNMRLDIVQKFQQFHTNMDVLRRIMDRVQLREEKSSTFIDAIISLRNQLREPLVDYQLVDIIKRNLKPRIASLIFATQIYSVEHLRVECRKAEDLLEHEFQQRSRQNMSARAVNEISLDDFDIPILNVEEFSHRKNSKQMFKTNNSTDAIKCWNCNSNGHTFRQCMSTQRSLFCFKCGTPGVITPQCGKCKQGNRFSNVTSGESRSTQTID